MGFPNHPSGPLLEGVLPPLEAIVGLRCGSPAVPTTLVLCDLLAGYHVNVRRKHKRETKQTRGLQAVPASAAWNAHLHTSSSVRRPSSKEAREFNLRCLQAFDYDPKVTAQMTIKNFDYKSKFFGMDKVAKTVTLKILNEDDIAQLRNGMTMWSGLAPL